MKMSDGVLILQSGDPKQTTVVDLVNRTMKVIVVKTMCKMQSVLYYMQTSNTWTFSTCLLRLQIRQTIRTEHNCTTQPPPSAGDVTSCARACREVSQSNHTPAVSRRCVSTQCRLSLFRFYSFKVCMRGLISIVTTLNLHVISADKEY